jgi:hypothetical protein
MKRINFSGAALAAGFIFSTVASSFILSTTAVDARQGRGQNRYNRGSDCDRDWYSTYCRDDDDRDWYNWNNQYTNRRLVAGTRIPTQSYRQGRIVLRRWERHPLTLVAENRITNRRSDRVVIPDGSLIRGALVPINRGYRFESSTVTFPNGRRESIAAVSRVIDGRDSFDPDSRDSFVLTPAALLILSYLFGRSDNVSPLFLGNIFNRYPNVRRDLVVVRPDQDLDLRLTRDFVVR